MKMKDLIKKQLEIKEIIDNKKINYITPEELIFLVRQFGIIINKSYSSDIIRAIVDDDSKDKNDNIIFEMDLISDNKLVINFINKEKMYVYDTRHCDDEEVKELYSTKFFNAIKKKRSGYYDDEEY